jgi:hypothetical protein
MTRNRLTAKTIWPWLLIIVIMVSGSALASCKSSAPTATPTPTKTPRPANAAAAATPQPIATATEAPTATSAPATATEPSQPQPTDTPAATPTAGPSPTTAKPTPTARPPSASPVVKPGDPMASPDVGIQEFLWWRPEVADRDLQLAKEAGFTWAKQLVSWQDIEGAGKGQYDWTNLDRLVEQAQAHGLKLIVRVSQDPDRPFWAGNPPQNAGDFADFLAAVASRYAGRIQAYQVWNEPNLAREWGGKHPDAAGYARLLKIAYGAIKGVDPNAIVITAGMAPTTQDNDLATPDLKFYDQMYQAMGGKSDGYFDMLGAHAAGYAVAPETDPQVVAEDPKLHNNDPSPTELKRVYAFRHLEDVRKLMERYGDQDKRVVILEYGWTTDNRPSSPYYWHGAGAGIDEIKQGCYLLGAIKWAREHWKPWIALMSTIYMPDVNWTKNDEQYYWSIIGPGYPDLYLRAPYVMLQNYLTKGIVDDNCPQYK